MINGVPAAVGAVFTGDATSGSCSLINAWDMTNQPIQRSGTSHVIMRRGFLTSSSQPTLLAAAQSTSSWTSALADSVVNANALYSQLIGNVDWQDPLWNWIDSIPTNTTAQGVSFRKSIYSLSFPVHPHVFSHLRYLRNYFAPLQGNTTDHAELYLALSWKYRHLETVQNSTSTHIVQRREGNVLFDTCSFAGLLDANGNTRFPLCVQPRTESHIPSVACPPLCSHRCAPVRQISSGQPKHCRDHLLSHGRRDAPGHQHAAKLPASYSAVASDGHAVDSALSDGGVPLDLESLRRSPRQRRR
jgi:hypothetical protein